MRPIHEAGLLFALVAFVTAFVLAVVGHYVWAFLVFAVGAAVGMRCADAIEAAEERRREIDE